MAFLIGGLLAILVIGVALYPFLKPLSRPATSSALDSAARVGRGGREAIYEEIKTLQLEYELGSIEEGEYQERLRVYRLEAAAALRDQERLEGLQEDILAARAMPGVERGSATCRSCGRPLAQEDRVCGHCGAKPVHGTAGYGEGEGDEGPLP